VDIVVVGVVLIVARNMKNEGFEVLTASSGL
jgi:hypothetical protein